MAPFKLTRQELTNLVPADWANTNVDWFSSKKVRQPGFYSLHVMWV